MKWQQLKEDKKEKKEKPREIEETYADQVWGHVDGSLKLGRKDLEISKYACGIFRERGEDGGL